MRIRSSLFRESPAPDGGTEQTGVAAARKRSLHRIIKDGVIAGRKLSQPQWLVEQREGRELLCKAGGALGFVFRIVMRLIKIESELRPRANPIEARGAE